MKIGVLRETYPGEARVALTPAVLPQLAKLQATVLVEAGAGRAAGFADSEYQEKGATILASRREVLAQADVLACVRTYGANPQAGAADLPLYRVGQVMIGFADPLNRPELSAELAGCGVSLLAMELVPRITRAQSMDALSSMASIAGYKAVLLAAGTLPRMFPMMMTAAGTITPAKVFVIGAGVAGLQAIATARRLGALVEAYDLRPAVKEQVESLGARFASLELSTQGAEGTGGYAREMDEAFYTKQREMMARIVHESDVVISTAAVPGRKAPVLVTKPMVESMRIGSVIVDMAAEQGGNCELTRPDEIVDVGGVTVLGPTNLAAGVPYHASQTYARNLTALLGHLAKDGSVQIDPTDVITAGVLVCREGQVVNPAVQEALAARSPTAAVTEGSIT